MKKPASSIAVRGKIMSAVLIIKNPPGEGEDDPAVDLFSQGLSLMFHILSASECEYYLTYDTQLEVSSYSLQF